MLKRFLSSSILHFLVGATICVYLGAKWGMQMRQFHENDMFQGRRRLDASILSNFSSLLFFFAGSRTRDIVSNRSGFVQGARSGESVDGRSVRISITVGIYSLMYDNVSEHLRTVNIIERFNIHEEIIVGTLYRLLPIQVP